MPGVICTLLPMARNDRLCRIYMDVLVQIGEASLEPVLKHFLSDSSEARTHFAWVLGELRDARAAPALIDVLKTDDSGLRREATQALAMIRAGSALETLLELGLTDRDPSVRIIALTGLGHLRRKIDSQRLLARIQSQQFKSLSDQEKDLLFNALGAAGSNDVVRSLAKLLEPNWIGGWRKAEDLRRAATALARIGTPGALAVLEKHSEHRKPELAAACRAALQLIRKGR